MFMIGQHIQVVASSQLKSGTNIRIGSTGFITNIFESIIVEKLNIALVLCEVIFNRYGFEKKNRSESKYVIVILPYREPYVNSIKLKSNFNKLISTLIDMQAIIIRNFDLLSYNIKKPIYIIATPINTNIYKNKYIHRAWFLSIYKNKNFISQYLKMRANEYDNTNVLFENFKNVSESHNEVLNEFLAPKIKYYELLNLIDKYYDELVNNNQNYIEFINIIKSYIQLFNLNNMKIAKHIINHKSSKMFNLISALYLLMTYRLGVFNISPNNRITSQSIFKNGVHYWLNKLNNIKLN